jgi:hypothetical protein
MRVLSLLASGTEIVCALGAGDTLVGRSHECDNPQWVRTLPACTRPAFDVSMSSGEIDAGEKVPPCIIASQAMLIAAIAAAQAFGPSAFGRLKRFITC